MAAARGAVSTTRRAAVGGVTCSGVACSGPAAVGRVTYSAPHRYVGELISDSEADVREEDSYLFDLDNKVTLAEGLDVKV